MDHAHGPDALPSMSTAPILGAGAAVAIDTQLRISPYILDKWKSGIL